MNLIKSHNNIRDMFSNQSPPMVSVPCGGGPDVVKTRIEEVFHMWLGFAERYAYRAH